MPPDSPSLAQDTQHGSAPSAAPNQLKRKRPSTVGTALPPSPTTVPDEFASAKRIKCDDYDARPRSLAGSSPPSKLDCVNDKASYIASPPSSPVLSSAPLPTTDDVAIERIKDVVQYQFGFEILMKHKELRLIEQEMAKCQVALEQLRRCHLIPYPTACPTPEQMLDIAGGRGAAVRPRPGAAVPKWAAPFGVVDGPYARHYAKWLIPDPVFDGPLPNWPGLAPSARSKSAATAEARATRNSLPDSSRGRPMRGLTGQKLHSLSSGYPQPKDKAGPCVLKRADGKVVKLVCIDCHRENFSSTQGFINHCRIAHKRDFKSHEEAAVHCGHPIDAESLPAKKSQPQAPGAKPAAGPTAAGPVSGVGVAPSASAPSTATAATVTGATAFATTAATASSLATPGPAFTAGGCGSSVPGHVYPLARNDTDAVNSLLRHIDETFKQCTSAAVPVKSESTKTETTSPHPAPFVGSDKAPFLSRFMRENKLAGNLQACVDDAKEVMDLDEDFLWSPDAGEELSPEPTSSAGTPAPAPAAAAAKRIPARQAKAAVSFVSNMDGSVASDDSSSRRSSSQSVSSQMSFGTPSVCTTVDFDSKTEGLQPDGRIYDDDEMDVDLSPNTIASNNAPSLVSDDGEYDDSDDGSSSETSDTDLESVSDVAEINMDEDEDQTHETPRPLRHHRVGAASASAMKLKKDEAKHVAFVSPVTGTDNVGQPQQ